MRIAILLALLLFGAPARAERFEVRMLNRNDAGGMVTGGMVFEPAYLRLRPGDSVKFLATNVTHNAATMPELLPAGAAPFKGRIDQEIEVAFQQPGLYGIKCIPHYAMGMVMIVEVGEPAAALPPLPPDTPPGVRERLERIMRAR